MSMSTHVYGVRDLDGKFKQMIAAKVALEAAGIEEYPAALKEYFTCEQKGIDPSCSVECLTQEMESVPLGETLRESRIQDGTRWEVDLSHLPEGVKAIRFEQSW